jgi:F0F1-type ATP synthase membrane subunit b/b'
MAFHLFMAESSGIGGLFQALGLNWQSFLLDLAAFLVTAARQRAQEQGDRLVAEAREQLSRDVLAARKQLKGETAALVAEATEAVLGEKLNRENDGKLISRSLEEAK